MNEIISQNNILEQRIKSCLELWWNQYPDSTKQTYINSIKRLGTFVSEEVQNIPAFLLRLQAVDAFELFTAFRIWMKEKYSSSTVNLTLSALRSLLKLMRSLNLIEYDIAFRNLKSSPLRDTSGPGRENIKTVINFLSHPCLDEKEECRRRRNLCIIRLFADLGIRRSELCNLKWEDYIDDNIWITRKGDNEKTSLSIPISSALALDSWKELHPGTTEYIFCSLGRRTDQWGNPLSGKQLRKIVQRIGKQFGLKLNPHGFRHTAITEAMKLAQALGKPIESVLQFSGHQNLNMLMVYRDNIENVQGEIAKAVSMSYD